MNCAGVGADASGRVTRDLATTLDLEPLLENVLSQLRAVIEFTGASVGMVQGEQIEIVAYDGSMARGEVLGRSMPLALLAPFASILTAPKPVIFADRTLRDICPPELWGRVRGLLPAPD